MKTNLNSLDLADKAFCIHITKRACIEVENVFVEKVFEQLTEEYKLVTVRQAKDDTQSLELD